MDFKQRFSLSPERHWAMTFALGQALEILQKPQQELAEWLRIEIEKNPLLEFEDTSIRKLTSKSRIEIDLQIPSPICLHEHLLSQIRDHFPEASERMLAEELLQHLDECGFIKTSLETIATLFKKSIQEVESVLSVLQTFDPPGICARNLQEAFLIQLKAQGKKDSLAFQLVQDHYDDLLHGRYALMKKKLGTSEISAVIRMLSRLQFRPADQYKKIPAALVSPDFDIVKTEKGWAVSLDETELPCFHFKTEYLSLAPESPEEKESLRTFIASAKWICRSLNRRRKLLKEIGRLLVRKQAPYLDQKGPLAPLTVKEISEELQVHESTISRALSGKYAATPNGTIPIRSLISSSPIAQTAKETLQKLIESEDKKAPFTDIKLVEQLRTKGFLLSRRTVAKYRDQLKVGSATQRKNCFNRQKV